MKAEIHSGNIRAQSPDCNGALTTFEFRDHSHEFGLLITEGHHSFAGSQYSRVIFRLYRCAGCGGGGLGKLHDSGRVFDTVLEWFVPNSIEVANLPEDVPQGVVAEYREAELCASVGAWRATSGLFRSTLEKALKYNGYVKGTLASRIDEASMDGIITGARRKRAHEDVRSLGNDVLHNSWREVAPDEVDSAHHYVQRILENFYDDRASVETILKAKGKLPEQV